jgi:hypothetical protein
MAARVCLHAKFQQSDLTCPSAQAQPPNRPKPQSSTAAKPATAPKPKPAAEKATAAKAATARKANTRVAAAAQTQLPSDPLWQQPGEDADADLQQQQQQQQQLQPPQGMVIPDAPPACTPDVVRGMSWGVATAAYQVQSATTDLSYIWFQSPSQMVWTIPTWTHCQHVTKMISAHMCTVKHLMLIKLFIMLHAFQQCCWQTLRLAL